MEQKKNGSPPNFSQGAAYLASTNCSGVVLLPDFILKQYHGLNRDGNPTSPTENIYKNGIAHQISEIGVFINVS